MSLMKMENLFQKANLNYQSMELNTPYDVTKFNFRIKSYNHSTSSVEYNRILNLVRKDDSIVYHLVMNDNTILLKCTSNHRVYDESLKDYVFIGDVKEGTAINENGQTIKFKVVKTDTTSPILDMQVENVNNYFSNGILSHNTTPGGNAVKFFASIRCEVRKGEKTEGENDGDDLIGIIAKVKNIKNKTSIPLRKGELFFSFTEGLDVCGEYVDFGVSMGFIQKGGAWFTVEGERFQGRANVIKGLKSDNALFQKIKSKVDAELAGNPLVKLDLPETAVAVDLPESTIKSLAELAAGN